MGKNKICQKYIIFQACLFSQRLCGSHQRLIWRIISDSWIQLCFPKEKIILLSDKEFSCWEKKPSKLNQIKLQIALKCYPKRTTKKSVSNRNDDTLSTNQSLLLP